MPTFTPIEAALSIALPVGLVAAAVVHRWPRGELLAPHVDPSTVVQTAVDTPVLRRFLRARMDPATETGLLLSAAVVTVVAGASVAGVITAMIHAHRGLATYDLAFADWGAARATASSTLALKRLSALGGYPVVTALAIGTATVEHRRGMGRGVVPLLVLVIGGQYAVVNTIKFVVDRARPDVAQLTGFAGSSFPSGHAAAASASYAVAALLLSRRRPRWAKSLLGGLALGIAAAVASTRVLLGVHWFTDVLTGVLVGWTWFAMLSIAFGGQVLRFGDTLRRAEAVLERTEQRTE